MHRAVVFIDQSFIPKLFENPPHALHERLVHGAKCALHVGPAADARNYFLPLMHIREHAIPAVLIEFCDTVLVDLLFVLEAEFFLDDVFYRQAMAIPPPHTRHAVAAHSPVARYDVFDDGSNDVPVVREPCRKRRAVIENVLAVWRLFFKRFLKNLALLPKSQCFFLSLGDLTHSRIVAEKSHLFWCWNSEKPQTVSEGRAHRVGKCHLMW